HVSLTVVTWRWHGAQRPREPQLLPADQADHYFGLRYAREALDLDPAYQPAQAIFLSLTLDQAFSPNREKFLLAPTPKEYHDLLATLDSELLMATLDRALTDRNVAVILPLVRALGQRGEVRAARPSGTGNTGGLARARYYPDGRG